MLQSASLGGSAPEGGVWSREGSGLGGFSLAGGVWSRGVSLAGVSPWQGGFSLLETPLWTEWQTGVKYYLGHNFVAAGNKRKAAEMPTLCVSVGMHPTGMHSYLKLEVQRFILSNISGETENSLPGFVTKVCLSLRKTGVSSVFFN